MYQKTISLLFILAFSLLFLISCGGDPGTNIKSGKVLTGYYTEDGAYYPMEYKRSDIVTTNDNYTISFRLPENEAYDYNYTKRVEYYRDEEGNVRLNESSYFALLRNTVQFRLSNIMKSYINKLKMIVEEPLILIERTGIKTEKLKNPKYYLMIGLYGVEPGTEFKEYKTYIYKSTKITNIAEFEGFSITNIDYGHEDIPADSFILYKENLNIAFITMMRDGSKDELRPVHVENFCFFNDSAKNDSWDFNNVIRTQLFKFVDEVDYGYRGKLPPKPKSEDDEY